MCILFLYVNPKPSTGKFRLVLAANRDEFFKRPTKAAHFWEEDQTVVGGRDLEPGKEGGSWLALSTRGHLAALLNLMHTGEHPPELLGRGSLVSNFVKGTQSGELYLNAIANNAKKYRPFNFLTVEIGTHNSEVCTFSNAGDTPKIEKISEEYLGIGNSFLGKPFAKVLAGVNAFKTIIQENGPGDKKALNKKLLSFLKDEKCHFPDEVLANYSPGIPTKQIKIYSSIFVRNPTRGYGTRAHTIITVDAERNADFNEWTLKDPIDANNLQWESSHFSFQLSS